ncbi:hypothetical protein HPB48_010046 [Haemaphysalis longicornis]|uniref:Uncharacterized protein n=1 Tax=Haemaphysalis longicornis TaxID=44386 RepID=A0A9J6GB79_HAELO|nr:hypothetical protein HPB48_010046 [Haemaphysalis longicornis]
MVADKNTCVVCSRKLTSRQQSLKRSHCGKRVHCKCITWSEEELQLLLCGEIPFTCYLCEKQRPPTEDVAPADGAISAAPPRLSRDEESRAPQPGDLENRLCGLRELLLNALQGISLLTDEVNALRQENARLHKETVKNSNMQAAAITSLQGNVHALRLELGKPKHRRTSFFNPRPSPPPPPQPRASTQGQPTSESASPPASLLPATTNWASSSQEHLGDTRRRVRDVAVGANNTSDILSVPRRPLKKALFVSRSHPDTSAADVTKLVNSVVTDNSAECTQLKSKYTSYASFHVSVSAESFAVVNDATMVAPRGPSTPH